MNLLIITPLYPPAVGGAASHFGKIAPTLAKCQSIKKIFILTEKMLGEPIESQKEKVHLFRRLPSRLSVGQRPFFSHAISYLRTELWFAKNLPKFVKSNCIDLVHFHTRYAGPLFIRSLQQLNLPLIADSQDKLNDIARLIPFTQGLICCGEGVAQFAAAQGYPTNRTFYIPIPFEKPKLPQQSQRDEVRKIFQLGRDPYILYVGDITPNKGIYELLDGFDQWRTSHPNVRLVLVGVNREKEKFITLVERAQQVVYLGHISHDHIPSLMSSAEIVILPSKSEGLPRVMLEALAVNCKVIAPPDIPEFDRYIPEFIVPEISGQAIADRLEKVWLSAKAPQYPLEEHQIDRIVDQLQSVYLEVMSKDG